MSSTNRGYDRHKSDYYVTPQDAIENFMYHWMKDLESEKFDIKDDWSAGHYLKELSWLDPCAGGDENHEMSYPVVINRMIPHIYRFDTLDIREDSRAKWKGDYLKHDLPPVHDVIITNPPFNLAQEIIEKAQRQVKDRGFVIMLLRLNFFGSQKRRGFWTDNMPVKCYVHRKRMSFTDEGGTDSIEYMHAVWQKDVYSRNETILQVI